MEVISSREQIRVSPRKMRLVAPIILGLSVEAALVKLRFTPKDAAHPIAQVLKTAQADALHNHKVDVEKLVVKDIQVSEGPTLKRGRPVSRGRYHPIMKRTSHLKVVLEG